MEALIFSILMVKSLSLALFGSALIQENSSHNFLLTSLYL
jgi:hypothetical protein